MIHEGYCHMCIHLTSPERSRPVCSKHDFPVTLYQTCDSFEDLMKTHMKDSSKHRE